MARSGSEWRSRGRRRGLPEQPRQPDMATTSLRARGRAGGWRRHPCDCTDVHHQPRASPRSGFHAAFSRDRVARALVRLRRILCVLGRGGPRRHDPSPGPRAPCHPRANRSYRGRTCSCGSHVPRRPRGAAAHGGHWSHARVRCAQWQSGGPSELHSGNWRDFELPRICRWNCRPRRCDTPRHVRGDCLDCHGCYRGEHVRLLLASFEESGPEISHAENRPWGSRGGALSEGCTAAGVGLPTGPVAGIATGFATAGARGTAANPAS
mmetsp:Transcript_38087/g.104840  ORF Transcript_38087/g.104840 Transcript_38087/m.104840 type:complete len:266 (+) Transcript_38087:237-1034(+)